MGFITQKRTLGMIIESTPYTSEAPAAIDFNLGAYNITYDLDIPMKARKLARGYYARDISVAGKRKFTCSFSVDMYVSAALDTPPNYFKALKMCGLLETVYAGVGVGLTPVCENSSTPGTIEIVEKNEGNSPSQLVITGGGCMGSFKIVGGNVGEPVRIDFEFTGFLVSVLDRNYASILNPTGISDVTPDAILAAGFTLFAEAQTVNTFTLDSGNVIEIWTDPAAASGYSGARVVDRDPKLELDPDMELIATQSDYSRWIGNTTGAFSFTLGDLTTTAPAAQYTKAYAPGDREGHVTNQKSMELKKGAAGNDEFEILQGAKA